MGIKIVAVVNPISGRGRGLQELRKLLKHFDKSVSEVDVILTRMKGDAYKIARERHNCEVFLCAGGDGTLNEVINGFIESGKRELPKLAFLPVGTGNVFAKEHKIVSDFIKLSEAIAEGRSYLIDVGYSPGRSFVNMAGAGFDAEIVRKFHSHRKGPTQMAKYLFWGLETIFNYQPPKIEIIVDGKLITKKATNVIVSNSLSYGGPLQFMIDASTQDGILDIMWYEGAYARDLLRLFWYGFEYNPVKVVPPDVHFVKGKEVLLRSDREVPLQTDGDPAGILPVEYKVLPKALEIITPAINNIL